MNARRLTRSEKKQHKKQRARRAGARHRQPPLPGWAPWIAMGALVATTSVATPAAAAHARVTPSRLSLAPSAAAHRFDIPPGPLRTVLAAVAGTTGTTIDPAYPELLDIDSPGVSGRFTLDEALQHALAGTGLVYRRTGPATVRLELRRLSESVDVAGQAVPLFSPKYTQPLENTPQTIVVIPNAVLQEQQVTSLRDALRNTPGITFHAGEGGSSTGDNLLIRGFSAANDVYIDGARDPGVLSRDMFDVEHVEVAKGPTSVTAGRGATGGSINLVTKQAQPADFAQVQFDGGSSLHRRGTIDVNHTLGDHAAFRLNSMWQDSGVPRREAVVNRAWGFAPSVGFGIGTPTRVTVNYQHLHQHNIPDYGLPARLPDAATAAGVTVDDLRFSSFYGLSDRDHQITDSDVASVIVDHQFENGWTLRNLSRYGRNTLDLVVTPPRAATAANAAADPGFDPLKAQMRRTDTKYRNLDDKTLNNQTDLTTSFRTGRMTHTVVTGLELSREDQPAYGVADSYANGRPPVTDLFNPDPGDAYVPSIVRTGATSEGVAGTVALYAFDTVKLSEQWQVDGGLRWDHVAAKYTAVAAPAAGAATGAASTFNRTDEAPSGRAGIVYKPVSQGSVYAAYSTSFSPSFDGAWGLTLSSTGKNSAALPPQRSRNIEAGTKWELLNRRLLVATALFQTEMTNAQTTDDAGNVVLAGNQRVRGIEFDVSGQLTDRWSVLSGLSFMQGTVEASRQAAEVGQQLAYVPRASFNIWTTYELPRHLTVGGGAQFSDGYFFNNTNALTTANAAAIQALTKYWLFNAMASYPITSHFRLQINGMNLTDTRYVDRGYTGHFIPGAGRAIVFSPVVTF